MHQLNPKRLKKVVVVVVGGSRYISQIKGSQRISFSLEKKKTQIHVMKSGLGIPMINMLPQGQISNDHGSKFTRA